mmetsp:Transcript_3625/g.8754  ORF Transcript_3625/g.8754 Transcript_3625/m.8754 type:complete len:299 (+) Transcript_3625:452-1348(+)
MSLLPFFRDITSGDDDDDDDFSERKSCPFKMSLASETIVDADSLGLGRTKKSSRTGQDTLVLEHPTLECEFEFECELFECNCKLASDLEPSEARDARWDSRSGERERVGGGPSKTFRERRMVSEVPPPIGIGALDHPGDEEERRSIVALLLLLLLLLQVDNVPIGGKINGRQNHCQPEGCRQGQAHQIVPKPLPKEPKDSGETGAARKAVEANAFLFLLLFWLGPGLVPRPVRYVLCGKSSHGESALVAVDFPAVQKGSTRRTSCCLCFCFCLCLFPHVQSGGNLFFKSPWQLEPFCD